MDFTELGGYSGTVILLYLIWLLLHQLVLDEAAHMEVGKDCSVVGPGVRDFVTSTSGKQIVLQNQMESFI